MADTATPACAASSPIDSTDQLAQRVDHGTGVGQLGRDVEASGVAFERDVEVEERAAVLLLDGDLPQAGFDVPVEPQPQAVLDARRSPQRPAQVAPGAQLRVRR